MIKEIQIKYNKYKVPILYSSGSIVKAISAILVGFIIAKYISPNDLGLWTAINIAVTYSVFLQAGLINGLNIELPYAYGKGDEEEAKNLAGTTQTFTFIISGIILLSGIACFLLYPTQNLKIKFGILAITFIIILNYYQNYLMSTFRSKNSFLNLSIVQIVDAFLNIASLVLVVYYSYFGMIIKAVFVISIYVILLHLYRPIRNIRWLWNKAAFIKLLKIGLPIFGLVCLDSFTSTIDKLLLIKYTDLNNVGLYSFGLYALTLFSLFSSSVASYVYPRMTYNYGKNNDKKIIWQYVKKITLLISSIQIPFVIIGYFIIPIFIKNYFHSYILSITAMQILLFAGFFKGCVIGVNALWSLKKLKYMILYQTIYSFFLIICTYFGIILFKNKIEGVAYGVLLANFLNLFSGLFLTYLATKK